MDLYIEDKFEIQVEENKINIFQNFISKNEKEINENYILNDTLSYIKNFEEVLIEYKLIDNNNNILKKNDKNKIEIFAKKYNFLKDNLNNNEHYRNSFYEDFKSKI